ncbi:hypothetical protein [Inquilinus limosus]|uniref:Uncharacterized protein n=1 Tax=Inquilinus limosus TaxID=171674 RepID=A0A211ZQB6_9PROT|nr:hypothetical protein [Inquilinus limosus]OWJ67455.1 hypothetical protein BWR60_09625 [Inquilinus limosus]
MALSDTTVPYEILIRFDEAGTPKGAHVQWRRIVMLDGEILKDDVLPAAPLSLDGLAVSEIMSDATAAALRRVTDLETENADLLTQRDQLATQVVALTPVPVPEPDPEAEAEAPAV